MTYLHLQDHSNRIDLLTPVQGFIIDPLENCQDLSNILRKDVIKLDIFHSRRDLRSLYLPRLLQNPFLHH